MTTPADHSQSESTYVIDAENAAEMARLTNQDRLVTKAMGGLFPQGIDLLHIHDILDIACGPGGWMLDVAREHPQKQVMGVDISNLMIEYAGYQAYFHGLSNARFRVMNVMEPLDLPDNSFDLVNSRLIFAFMSPGAWPKLLQECLRITRPGGIIRLTEMELNISNSLAFEKMTGICGEALRLAGQSFSPDGRNIGITPMLGRFLLDAGCQDIQKRAYIVDFSSGTEAYKGFYQDYLVLFKLFQPFLIKMGVTTQEEVEALYHRILAEMQADDFCGIFFVLSAWGQKPQ